MLSCYIHLLQNTQEMPLKPGPPTEASFPGWLQFNKKGLDCSWKEALKQSFILTDLHLKA